MRQRARFWAVGAAVLAGLGHVHAESASGQPGATGKRAAGTTQAEGPPARALYAGELRLPVLLEQLSKRSGETVTAKDFAAFSFGSADPARRLMLGASVTKDGSWVAFTPGMAQRTAAPSAAQRARGLLPIPDTTCALTHGQGSSVEVCGDEAVLAASSADILARYAKSASQHDVDVEFSPRDIKRSKSVYELRSDVPDFVSALTSALPGLADDPAAVLALSDLAYGWAYGVAESYEQSGPMRWRFDFETDGSARTELSVRPHQSSLLARAAASGRNQTAPDVFWQLPSSTQLAFYSSTGNLRPFLEPSPRALELLARAAVSPTVRESPILPLVASVAQSCLAAERTLVFAIGDYDEAPTKAKLPKPGKAPAPAKTGPSSKRASVDAIARTVKAKVVGEKRQPYMMLGIEDPSGACGHSLEALFHAVGSPANAGSEHGFTVAQAKLPADFPRPASVLSLGDSPVTQLGFASSTGTAWLVWGNELDQLRAVLRAVLHPNPHDVDHVRRRSQLAELAVTPTLLGGFVDLPRLLPKGTLGAERLSQDFSLFPMLLFSREGELVSTGTFKPSLVSTLLATFVSGLENHELRASASADEHTSQRKLLSVGCKLGSDEACNQLGVIFTDGKGVPADPESARPLFKIACDHDHASGCGNLGYLEKKLHPDAARSDFDKGCSLGNGRTCLAFGAFLLDTGKPGDYALALEKNQQACDQRVRDGCLNLAYQYTEGKGTAVNLETGADFNEQACALGSGFGCVGMGNALMSGKGRPHNEPDGLRYYARACRLEKGMGCYLLGLSYANGRGTAKDLAKAREYLGTSCDAGHAEACRELAEIAEDAP